MANWEDILRQRVGMPVEQAGKDMLNKLQGSEVGPLGPADVAAPRPQADPRMRAVPPEVDQNYDMANKLLEQRALAEQSRMQGEQGQLSPQDVDMMRQQLQRPMPQQAPPQLSDPRSGEIGPLSAEDEAAMFEPQQPPRFQNLKKQVVPQR